MKDKTAGQVSSQLSRLMVFPDPIMSKIANKLLLVVVAKEPVPGQVKTRFSPEITSEEAAAIYRCMVDDKMEEISRLTSVDLAIAFTPPDAGDTFAAFQRLGFKLFSQQGDDLGERLSNIFADKFSDGYDAVVIIDSDSPDLPQSTVREAFRLLISKKADLVLGPCRDGGYYLIGLRKLHPELFENIPWSTAEVLDATMEKTLELGLKTELLSWGNDLDTFADLVGFYKKYSGENGGGKVRGEKTLSFLSGLEKIKDDDMSRAS